MMIYKLYLFPTIIYENYITNYARLYPSSTKELYQEWENAGSRQRKRRYSKPANFQRLYNKLSFFQHKLHVHQKVHWTMNIHDSKSTIVTRVPTKSFSLKSLKWPLSSNNKNLAEYNVLKLRGFTFDQEKVFDGKLLKTNKKHAIKRDFKLKQT